MSAFIPQVTCYESAKFNLLHVVPGFLRGAIVAERKWLEKCERWLCDPVSVRFINKLRKKYGTDRFYFYLLEIGANRCPRLEKTLLITSPADMEVVFGDPDSYASDAVAKVERMSLFQSGAVIISSGATAHHRRTFNEEVLDTQCGRHRYAKEFLDTVNKEVIPLQEKEQLCWDDFEQLSKRITSQVMLGQGKVDMELSDALTEMIRKASRLYFYGPSDKAETYHNKLERHISEAGTSSLLGLCRSTPSQDTPVAAQITHWLFAMKDALEVHVPRTLALIASHPDIAERVYSEAAGVDLSDPKAVGDLRLLEGCVHEAVRLWTPVPLLLRRTTRAVTLNEAEIATDTQVLVYAAFEHRDLSTYGDMANQFNPDQWLDDTPPPPVMNHFSNGPRKCAGKPLILFLIKAVLARLLQRHYYFPESADLENYTRIPYLLSPFKITFQRRPVPDMQADTRYDYIVVGSGAGGGPLAANLAKAGRKVLLLEAGADDSRNLTSQVPALHILSTEDDNLGWRYFVQHYTDPQRQRADPKFFQGSDAIARPQPGAGIFYPRAGTLGGCTVHNALVTVCPHNSDWDYIADLTGDPSWRGTAMRQYYQRLERYRYGWESRPLRWLRPLTKGLVNSWARRGYDGWLTISRANPLLIFKDIKLVAILLASMNQVFKERRGGLFVRIVLLLRNLFRAYDPNHWRRVVARPEGIALTPIAAVDGRRNGPRDYINRVRVQHPDLLLVKTGALATRVMFDDSDPTHAVAVEYLDGARCYRAAERDENQGDKPDATSGPKRCLAKLAQDGEIILAGGTFNTPQLLMLSGIGPRDELARHHIAPCPGIGDAPGVGENLQDRYEVTLVTELTSELRLLKGMSYAPAVSDPYYFDWQTSRWRQGVYATNGTLLGITWRSAPERDDPDLYIFGGTGYFGGYEPGYAQQLTDNVAHEKKTFTWQVLKGHTRNSAGRIRLSSADPRDVPEINFHYFDDESGAGSQGWREDLDSVVEGIRFARRINCNGFLRRFVKGMVIPGTGLRFSTLKEGHDSPHDEEALREAVKRVSWGHHASGTCRIGLPGDGSVVDSEFRVHGTQNLRVVDASVFPRIPGLFIVTAIYMIAEKATDVLLTASRAR